MDDKIKDAPKYWQSIDSQNVSGTDEFPSGFVEELFEVVNAKNPAESSLLFSDFRLPSPRLLLAIRFP